MPYTPWASIRVTSCFCGIARIHVRYHDLHALGPYQSTQLLLWDRANSCFLWSFACIEAISDERVTFLGSLGLMLCIVFYTRWGNLRLTCCFCGIPRSHALYCVLRASRQDQTNELPLWERLLSCSPSFLYTLVQHQTSEVLLWDRPDSCFLLCFTRIGGISD